MKRKESVAQRRNAALGRAASAQTTCPGCKKTFFCPSDLRDIKVECPHCRETLIISSDSNTLPAIVKPLLSDRLLPFFVNIGIAAIITLWVSTWKDGFSNFIGNGIGFAMLTIVVICCLSGIWGLFGKEFITSTDKQKQGGDKIICPNQSCGYVGVGKRTGGTSGCLLLILLLLGIVPGILYLLFAGSPGITCPKCGMRIR